MASFSDNLAASRDRGLFARLHIDLPLLLGLLVLCACGLAILYSATEQSAGQVERQLIRLGLALSVMVVVAQIHPDQLRGWSVPLYLIGLVMLIAVAVIGEIGKGAQRWLDLGILRFQPSEILKLAVPMTLAWFFSGATIPPNFWRILFAMVFTALPVLLIARQPDLGTALMVGSSGVIVLFMAGLSWRLIALFAICAASAAPVLWLLMHDYQRQRVLTFLDPQSDPLGAGYHIIQSQIAIGSGGIYGKGWFHGTQSHLEFLPERSTDFIFAVLGEEFGLVGILVLMMVYLFIIYRGIFIAISAQNSYSRLLAGSIILVFFVYLFVNIGMVVGLLPVVGVPLPLVSYGGTSLVTIMAGFGILMSIHTSRVSQSR